MKNIFKTLVFLLLANSIQAQIVNIPDSNFKAALISIGIDTNADGEIQQIEALSITNLDVSNANISDLTGVLSFTNLVALFCDDSNITSLDIHDLNSLQELSFKNSDLNEVTLYNLPQLKKVNFSCRFAIIPPNPTITTIDFNNVPSIENINCDYLPLNTINFNNCINLKELYVNKTSLTDLDLRFATGLIILECQESTNLRNINLSGLSQFTTLNYAYDNLTNLNLSGTAISTNGGNVYGFRNLSTSTVENLNISNCVNLTRVDASLINLQTLDVTGCTNITYLDVWSNQLNTLDVSTLINLEELNCMQNTIVDSLDLSNNPYINDLKCSINGIKYLNLKNGNPNYNTSNFDITLNPLTHICVDQDEYNVVANHILPIYPNCVINSYCSFTPGGNYNTITGTTKFDNNNNGCDINDLAQPNIRININDGTNTGATFTNNNGNYKFYTQAGSFALEPSIENPSWFTFTPNNASIVFADNNNNTTTQDFCITANGVHHDVEMVIAAITPARPGFEAQYKLVYKNKGNQAEDVYPNFYFNDAVVDIVSTSLTPINSGSGFIHWTIPSVLPFESGEILITLRVNSPTDIPAVNIGDVLQFTSLIDVGTDDSWDDNAFTYNQTIVGSFDPNDIECLEGDVVAPSYIGEFLHYNINFENTGNFQAENIVVKTIIDTTKYDVNSLQLMNTSHNAYTRINGNVVEFIFETINLDSGGHGNILFKIKTVDNLVTGDRVAKRADIFFDYNAPIDTGMANTTFQLLNNGGFEIDNSISVYPNPTKGNVNINLQAGRQVSNNNIKSIELFDVQGRVLQTQLIDDVQTSINITDKSNGIYFLKVTTDKGSKVEKIVKE